MLESDRALLDGYRRGDRRALERIYRELSPVILRFLARLGVRALDLDAAHQEAFVRVFGEQARSRYDGLKPFRPYALGIARFAAIDLLRAQGKVMANVVELDESLSDGETPEEAAATAEVQEQVRRFLDTLPPVDRAFAAARFMEGLSQEKAGEQCGLSRQEARTKETKLRAQCMHFFTSKVNP